VAERSGCPGTWSAVTCAGPTSGTADLRGAVLVAADLRGARLQLTDLTGADLRAADVPGTYLGLTLFLSQPQANGSRGDARTVLPPGLERPAHWT
jgi:hypothetical protein